MIWLLAALIVLFVVVSGYYSGMETGTYSVNVLRLRLRGEEGDRRASLVLQLVRDARGLICVALIGTNIGSYGATMAATALLARLTGEGTAEALATVAMAPLLFVFGEVVPKTVFNRHADALMMATAGIARVSRAVFGAAGLVQVLKAVSQLFARAARIDLSEEVNPLHPSQQLRYIFAEGRAEGIVTKYQTDIAERIMGLGQRRLAAVMIPMGRVAAVEASTDRRRLMRHIRRHDYSRFVVYRKQREDVLGTVNVYTFLADETLQTVGDCVRPAFTLPGDTRVVDALLAMQHHRRAMTVVVDGQGRPIGIATIKDLVEEIVGDIEQW